MSRKSVLTITAEDMKLTGEVSVADALRSSTLNSLGALSENHQEVPRNQTRHSTLEVLVLPELLF